ncbi:MAG: tetratricopeptide repeat protein [Deltaproteobacteria bacterium]
MSSNLRPGLRLDVVMCAVFVAATLFVYWKIWTHDFIGYDDDKYVAQNRYVSQGLSRESVIWAFRSTHASNWHPLTWLSHMLDVELYGMKPGAHHMTSLLFHILNSLLLFIVLRKMTGHVWQSGVVALLFAIHPLHVESVAWVAERKDVLSTFFWMLTLWSYTRYTRLPGMIRYLPVVGFFALGLMAKPMVVTLPFVMLLLDFWPLNRIQSRQLENHNGKPVAGLSVLQLVYEKIPLFVLAGISCVITLIAQKKGEALGLLDAYPLVMRLANAAISYVKYLQKLFWPHDLAILYPYPATLKVWEISGACALLGAITFLSIWHRKRFPWLFVGWFWYAGTLLPVIGLVQVGVQAMADRYTYIPLIGVFVILSWGTIELFNSWRYRKMALIAIAAVVFSLQISSARAQVSFWKNSIRLFEHTLRVTAGNYVIHNNLGFELASQGQKDRALKHYSEALRINPGFELAHINYGSTLFAQGKIEESFAYNQALLKIRPEFAGVHYNFGILLLKTGRIDEAIVHFHEALRLKPDYAAAYNGLGAAMVAKGKIEEAIAHFKAALQIKPDLADAQNNLKNLSAYNRTGIKKNINMDFN